MESTRPPSKSAFTVDLTAHSRYPTPTTAKDLRLCFLFDHVEDSTGEKSPSYPETMRFVVSAFTPTSEAGESDDTIKLTCEGVHNPYGHASSYFPLFKDGMSLRVQLCCMNKNEGFQNSLVWQRFVSPEDLRDMLSSYTNRDAVFEGANPNLPYGTCSGTLTISFKPPKKGNVLQRYVTKVSFEMLSEHITNYMDYQRGQ